MTQSPQRIDEQAAHWAVRLHTGALTAEDQSTLDAWLQSDSRHPGALLRARAMWVDLDRLSALGAGTSPETVPAVPSNPEPVVRRATRPSRLAIAASLVALSVLAAGGLWWTQADRSNVYVSDVGEVRRVTLEDGSNMILNTATVATVRMDQSHRNIELDRGEGLFEVAKDPARPFVVHAGPVSVRAVGTVFSVRSIGKRIDVMVTEGVVEVLDNDSAGSLIRRVAANEHVSISDMRQVELQSLPQEQAARRLVWQDGMIAFDGESLADAVAEMNRHNRRRIVVDDAALAARPVVGLFRASDPDNFAATIAVALDARAVSDGDDIRLQAVSSP